MEGREERRSRSRSNSSDSSGSAAYHSPYRNHVRFEDEVENREDNDEYVSDEDTDVEDNGEPDANIVNRWFNAIPVRRQEDSSGSSDDDDSDDDDVEDSDGGSSDGESVDGESNNGESSDGESSDQESRSDRSSGGDSDGSGYTPRTDRSDSPVAFPNQVIRSQREEIRKMKRRLDSAYRDVEESEYYYRREKEAKIDLERKVERLEKEKYENELELSSMDYDLKMAEADNRFLTYENEMLSDLTQQYFQSKEEQIKYKDRAKRQLRKRKQECKDLKMEMSQIANADEYRRTIELERSRADNYQILMRNIHARYQNEGQQQSGQDTPLLRSCEICLQKYTDVGRAVPRILVKCGHTVCHACAESLRPREPDGVRCPFCRTLTEVSRRKGVGSLPKNFALVS